MTEYTGFDMTKPLEWNYNQLKKLNQNKMSKENRIPFDIEKWNSGEYEAVYRDGIKPLAIYHIEEANYQVISVPIHRDLFSHTKNGSFIDDNNLQDKDLFLIPKKKKGWVMVIEASNGFFPVSGRESIGLSEKKEWADRFHYKIVFESEFEY